MNQRYIFVDFYQYQLNIVKYETLMVSDLTIDNWMPKIGTALTTNRTGNTNLV